jgi:hypothetical protein
MTDLDRSRYIVLGVALGLFFPLIAIATDLAFSHLPFTFRSIAQLFTKGPLHWIILSAPLVLGTIFFFMHRAVAAREEILQTGRKQNEELIKKLGNYLQAIVEGNFSVSADDFNHPQLQQLVKSLKERIIKQRDEDERAKWVAEGHARFGEILRLNGDLKTLSDELLKTLVKYLNLNQGSVFIYEETDGNDGVLVLYSCYAYDRKKYLTKTIPPGEGLVGQCFIEKETTILKEIPMGYIKITSGLGEATPKFLLIIPIKTDQQIEGAMELAGFSELEDFQINFIEKICEAFASVIRSVKVGEETRRLLTETQSQTEQLRSQEEEIRQNMEEMQATQEDLSRQLEEARLTRTDR